MSDYELRQELLRWRDDPPRLIIEMKRLLDVRTDTELANALGRTQGAVSHWRRKGVPETVLLGFEKLRRQWRRTRHVMRAAAAQAVAMRAGFALQQRAANRGGERAVFKACATMAAALDSVSLAIEATIEALEEKTGRDAWSVSDQLFDDPGFLGQICDWIEVADWTDTFGCDELLSPPGVILPAAVY